MSEDPWKGLAPPAAEEMISARRVDATSPRDFFWAVDHDRRYMLVLQHAADSSPAQKLPRLKGLDISLHHQAGKASLLTFRLQDTAYRDIFERLCRDIFEHAAQAPSEDEAIRVAIGRTWRWHHLLRGGRDGRLSEDEQKGLIGELLVLDHLLLPVLAGVDAVTAWRGPVGAPKDFELGSLAIEAKARRGTATPYVLISSEHQLDLAAVSNLFLHVADLARAPDGTAGSASVTGFARRVRDQLETSAPAALELFDSVLSAAGLDLEENYDDFQWLEGKTRLFHVRDDFPRLTASSLPLGVSSVRYAIALAACDPFACDASTLHALIQGSSDGGH